MDYKLCKNRWKIGSEVFLINTFDYTLNKFNVVIKDCFVFYNYSFVGTRFYLLISPREIFLLNQLGEKLFVDKPLNNAKKGEFISWITPWGMQWQISNDPNKNLFIKFLRDLFIENLKKNVIKGFCSDFSKEKFKLTFKFSFDYSLLVDWVFYEFFIEMESLETFFTQVVYNHFFFKV